MKVCINCPSGKSAREAFYGFYKNNKDQFVKTNQVKIVTKTLERLIDREMMIGYGVRTPHKWYIKEVKLTREGLKEARKILGEQQHLPLN